HAGQDGADGLTVGGFQPVGAGGLRQDKGLGVVYRKGGKSAGGAGDAGLAALHQVQHVDAAVPRDLQRGVGGQAEGVDELPLRQAGAHHAAVGAVLHRLVLVQQVGLAEGGVPVPLDVGQAVVDVDGPGLAVQVH